MRQNIFRITQEGNRQCDMATQREVEAFLAENKDKHTIYNYSDLSRLSGNHNIDILITMREIDKSIN